MTILTIRIIPDPVLRQMAKPVAAVDKAVAKLMEDMADTMYPADGMGLGAPQVGVLSRVIVCDPGGGKRENALGMANPEILWHSEETYTHKEGCLSIPGQFADITRPKKIRLRFLDRDNRPQQIEAEDLFAICIQHEIDHLNGVLFFDYLSPLKRDMMIRKVEKAKKALDGGGFYD
ncbi:MAG: peptide deformylase [Alphaproteobacteria bacterium]